MYFISFYVGSVILIFALFGSSQWLTYVRLMTGHVAEKALVTATACSDRSTLSYSFDVGGKRFTGSGGDGYGNQPCSSLKPGDTALVYYLPARPEINLPGDPAARLISETSAIALLAFFVPILVLLISFGVLGGWRKKKDI
jgi:hypothetical protein